MKRRLALIFAAVVTISALSGCADNGREEELLEEIERLEEENERLREKTDTDDSEVIQNDYYETVENEELHDDMYGVIMLPEDDMHGMVAAPEQDIIDFKDQIPSVNIDMPEGANEEYAALYEANNDFTGWIRIQGTNIDYPVMQSHNIESFAPCNTYATYGYCEYCEQIMHDLKLAKQFYLHHDFGRNYLFGGNIFADYHGEIGPDRMPNNTILYGNNMLYEYQFSALSNYKLIDFLKESPVIDFNTLYNDNKYKIFSVFLVNTTEKYGEVFDYSEQIYFEDSSEFYNYIVECMDRSLYETGVDIEYGDELLTLSTYDESTGFDDMRLVIVARKVRPDEEPTVEAAKIVRKDSIKYFDAYYEAYGDWWKGRTWDTSLVAGLDDYLQ